MDYDSALCMCELKYNFDFVHIANFLPAESHQSYISYKYLQAKLFLRFPYKKKPICNST